MAKKFLKSFKHWKERMTKEKKIPLFDWLDKKLKARQLSEQLERFHNLPVGTREPDGTLTPLEIKHGDFMELYRIAKAQQELLSRKLS